MESGALTVVGGLVGIVMAGLTIAILNNLLPWRAVV